MTAPAYDIHARTDVGRLREGNEDRMLVVQPDDPAAGVLLCVADGMGGHPAGEEASQLAVEHLSQYEKRAKAKLAEKPKNVFEALSDVLLDVLTEAHGAIMAVGEAEPEKFGLGTTVVCALIAQGQMVVVHCGDSRCYLLRNETLELLTVDHVVVEGGIRYLAAHLGMPEGLYLEKAKHKVRPGDRVLLCSDGLTDMAPPEGFGLVLHEAKDAEQATEALVELALLAGGADNVTCVVAVVGPGK